MVQRLSAHVTGKAQKYSRIGPREFMQVGTDELATPMLPRSISVTQMLKLGKVVKSTQVIDSFQFDLSRMMWSTVPKPVEFSVSNHPLSEGAFRKAYTTETDHKEFSGATWVIKEYKSRVVDIIGETNQTVEAHTKKVVQMYCLAQNFANQCKDQIEQAGLQESLGKELQYGNIYLGKKGEDCVTVEEYVEGDFNKYINNDGAIAMVKMKLFLQKLNALLIFHMKNQIMSSCFLTSRAVVTGCLTLK